MRKIPNLKASMSFIRKARNLSRKDLYIGPLIPSLIVFGALLVIIGLSWRTAKHDVAVQYNAAVSQNTASVEGSLTQRFGIYEDTLRAGAGLFNSSDNVTRDEWRTFVNSLKLPSRYPGIRGVGFMKVVTAAERETFVNTIRAEGFTDYNISPAGDRDSYAPVTYIVPTGGNNQDAAAALGYDMYSDPIRREAMDKAAASGDPSLSGKVNLNRGSGPQRPGFILFIPIYSKGLPLNTLVERSAALQGFTYAPFEADNIFSSLFTTETPNFSFAIFDRPGQDSIEYYHSSPDYQSAAYYEAKRTNIALYGQDWLIIYKTKNEIVTDSLRERPLSVAYGGTIFAFVTAMMVYLLIQRRTNSLALADQRRLEEAKDELLSLASHQLRTPATAVKQYISMVVGGFAGKISKEQSRLLEMAYDSNERQLTIVDDLLYVARLDAGQATLAYERFNLNELLHSVIDDQRLPIKERRQSVKLHIPKRRIYLEGDPKYVRMALENLLSNASKYSREAMKIEVFLRVANKKVFINFVDQGVGISEADYEKVFEKFSRISNELTRQVAGSGIGLYLARQLIRLHGGDIILDSSLKIGSSFTIILPLKQER